MDGRNGGSGGGDGSGDGGGDGGNHTDRLRTRETRAGGFVSAESGLAGSLGAARVHGRCARAKAHRNHEDIAVAKLAEDRDEVTPARRRTWLAWESNPGRTSAATAAAAAAGTQRDGSTASWNSMTRAASRARLDAAGLEPHRRHWFHIASRRPALHTMHSGPTRLTSAQLAPSAPRVEDPRDDQDDPTRGSAPSRWSPPCPKCSQRQSSWKWDLQRAVPTAGASGGLAALLVRSAELEHKKRASPVSLCTPYRSVRGRDGRFRVSLEG